MTRRRKSLRSSLENGLDKYALAAGAGVLALAQPADAKVVYTHANVPIEVDGGTVTLDLNHDGINDFQFSNIFSVENRHGHSPSDAYSFSYLNVDPAQPSNRICAVESNGRLCAAAVQRGVRVGPHSPFQPSDSGLVMAAGSNGGLASCPWRPVMKAYLGLKFAIKGNVHFGWARIERVPSNGGGFPAVITGYAYETVPDKPIIAGRTKGPDVVTIQPASLGDLARGASAISGGAKQVRIDEIQR
jgi:hypothetical protein